MIHCQPEFRLALPTVYGPKDYRDFRAILEYIDRFLKSIDIEARFVSHQLAFIGWNKLSCNGVTSDLWHMSKGAVQKHRKFIEQKTEGNKTTLATQIDWLAAGGKNTGVEEVRTVTLLDADDAHLLLDVISELKAVGGRHYL